jgi:hypothetical protein
MDLPYGKKSWDPPIHHTWTCHMEKIMGSTDTSYMDLPCNTPLDGAKSNPSPIKAVV